MNRRDAEHGRVHPRDRPEGAAPDPEHTFGTRDTTYSDRKRSVRLRAHCGDDPVCNLVLHHENDVTRTGALEEPEDDRCRDVVRDVAYDEERFRVLYVVCDGYLSWHPKNIILFVFHEQGVFGLSVFLGLIIASLIFCIRKIQKKDPLSMAILSTIISLVGVGMVGTILDTSKVVFLFSFEV